MTQRDPATAPKGGDRIRYLHIVPEGKHWLRDRYLIKTIKVGDRIETPEFVENEGLQIDYYQYITQNLFSQLMQFFGLALDLVYEYLGKQEEYQTVCVPRLQALEESCRDEKGDLKAIFNKKKNDLTTKWATAVLSPILFPEGVGAICTAKGAGKTKKQTTLPFAPIVPSINKPPRASKAGTTTATATTKRKGNFKLRTVSVSSKRAADCLKGNVPATMDDKHMVEFDIPSSLQSLSISNIVPTSELATLSSGSGCSFLNAHEMFHIGKTIASKKKKGGGKKSKS
jgi:hypothetical protein